MKRKLVYVCGNALETASMAQMLFTEEMRAFFFFKVYVFIFESLHESARAHASKQGRSRERIPSRLRAVGAEPDSGLTLTI